MEKEKIILPREMEERTGLNRRTLIDMADRGEFCPRVKISPRRYGWLESSYNGWLAGRPRR